jgi:hypothetical protein
MKVREGVLMKAPTSSSPEKFRAELHGGRQCWENGSRTGLGEESGKRRLGFVNKSQKGEPLALMFLALYRQAKISKRLLDGVGFYMPLQ